MNFLLRAYVFDVDLLQLLAHVKNNIRILVMEGLVFRIDSGREVIIFAFRRIIRFSVRFTRELPRQFQLRVR